HEAAEHALAVITRMGGHDRLRSELFRMLGVLLNAEGKLDEAIARVGQSLTVAERVFGPSHPSFALILGTLGNFFMLREDYDEAASHLLRALAILEQTYGPHHPDLQGPLRNLGSVFREQKKYDEALANYQRSLNLAETAGSRPVLAFRLSEVGSVLSDQKKYAEALAYHRRALTILEETPDVSLWISTWILEALADTLQAQGEYKEALSLYQRSQAIQEIGSLKPDNLRGQGQVYLALRATDKAVSLLEQALSLR